jgi:hypothetical protein
MRPRINGTRICFRRLDDTATQWRTMCPVVAVLTRVNGPGGESGLYTRLPECFASDDDLVNNSAPAHQAQTCRVTVLSCVQTVHAFCMRVRCRMHDAGFDRARSAYHAVADLNCFSPATSMT